MRGMLKHYEVTLAEGAVLLEAGHVTARLHEVRRTDRTPLDRGAEARLVRLEVSLSKLLASLIAQMKVGRP